MPAKKRTADRPLWAVLHVHHDGVYYPPGRQLPDDLPDDVRESLIAGKAATTTKPKGSE